MSHNGQRFSSDMILGRHENTVNVDFSNKKNTNNGQIANKEVNVSEIITKTELDALLRANKAEVDAVAANVQKEMAEWREEQNNKMNQVLTALSTLDVKLDERYENQKGSANKTQWLIGIAIAVAALVPAIIGFFKSTPTQSVQPTVIYVQQPALQSHQIPTTLDAPKQ